MIQVGRRRKLDADGKILFGSVSLPSSTKIRLELLRTLVILVLAGGWESPGYFLDPTTGFAVVFGVQLAPIRDSEVSKVAKKLERTLYET